MIDQIQIRCDINSADEIATALNMINYKLDSGSVIILDSPARALISFIMTRESDLEPVH